MFEGDELSNTASVDLGKVQMFFFTIIVAFSYSVILFNNLANAGQQSGPSEELSNPVRRIGRLAGNQSRRLPHDQGYGPYRE